MDLSGAGSLSQLTPLIWRDTVKVMNWDNPDPFGVFFKELWIVLSNGSRPLADLDLRANL